MSYAGDHAIIHFITFMMTKTGKKPRWVWNCFWGVFLTIFIGFYIYTSCIVFGGLVTYQTEQIYEKYADGILHTNVDSYKIDTTSDLIEIPISKFLTSADRGTSAQFTVSKISGELYEIQYDGKILYKVSTAPTVAWAQQPLFLLGELTFCIGCQRVMMTADNLSYNFKKMRPQRRGLFCFLK